MNKLYLVASFTFVVSRISASRTHSRGQSGDATQEAVTQYVAPRPERVTIHNFQSAFAEIAALQKVDLYSTSSSNPPSPRSRQRTPTPRPTTPRLTPVPAIQEYAHHAHVSHVHAHAHHGHEAHQLGIIGIIAGNNVAIDIQPEHAPHENAPLPTASLGTTPVLAPVAAPVAPVAEDNNTRVKLAAIALASSVISSGVTAMTLWLSKSCENGGK